MNPLERTELEKGNAMQAQDVMSRPVMTLRPHLSARAAATLLVEHCVSAAPVVTAEGELRGMVGEIDLLRVLPLTGGAETGSTPSVDTVMSASPATVRPTDDLVDVVATLLGGGFRSVPVVVGGHLVGIISRSDVMRFLTRPVPTAGTASVRN
jgi:CBS-domain-containing membrane protein